MATELPQTIVRPESTDVRFTTRALLVVMALLALVAAAAGPLVRALAPDERIRFLAACGVWTAMVAMWIFVAARRRLAVEKLAGKALLRLPIYGTSYRWRRVNAFLLSMLIAGFGLGSMLGVAAQSVVATTIGGGLASALYSLVLSAVTAHSVTLWWWGHEARLSEIGVRWDRRLFNWSNLNHCWDSEREILTFSGPDQHGENLRFDVIVPEQLHDAVRSIVEDHIEKNTLRSGSSLG
jgi:hypothetical protein